MIPSYYLFRNVGWPRVLPMNLTLSVTYRCNSHCKTCNIWQKKADELDPGEWRKIFHSFGASPFWVTISGGEPFLRKDLAELVTSLYDICRPSIINIPTNGLLSRPIVEGVKEIADHCKRANIVVNLSLDEIREKHDTIRGVPGNYDRALNTFQALRSLKANNLSLGIHTVVSKWNVDRIPEICEQLRTFQPDSYITEIAEERVELGTIGVDVTPSYEEYARVADFLIRELSRNRLSGMGLMTKAFRLEYYKLVKRIINEKRQVIPCYAGFASAQISPDGDVWMCCVQAHSIGNLRESNYDFKRIWNSEAAKETRQIIKKGQCYCPLANVSYTNMLHHLATLFRVGWNVAFNR